MTDEPKKKRDSEEELVLDWDDAVDTWGTDLDVSAKAEAAPFPARGGAPNGSDEDSLIPGVFERPTMPPGGLHTDPMPPPSIPPNPLPSVTPRSRPSVPSAADPQRPRMYRPPTKEELQNLGASRERLSPSVPSTSKPSATSTSYPTPLPDPWEGDSDATQIATIPRELIESLSRADASERELNTRSVAAVTSDEDSVSISFEDADFDALPPRDTDPAPRLDDERSRVRAPETVRPFGAAGASDEAPASAFDSARPGDDSMRVVPLTVEDIIMQSEAPKRSVPPPPPVMKSDPPAAKTHSSPPPRREEISVLENLDELAPPMPPPRASAPPPELVVEPLEDRGAETARRTVRTQKPRAEHMPLTASDDVGRKARLELLLKLADRRSEEARAALLCQAAELAEELLDVEKARALYTAALEALPTHSGALWALARLSLASHDYARYVKELERLAKLPIERSERARALWALALMRWLVDGDLPSALRSATEAARLDPDEPSHALLLARLEVCCTPSDAHATLEGLAERTSDPALSAVLLMLAGRSHELRSDLDAALADHRKAMERAPDAFDARLTTARLAELRGLYRVAAEALSGTLELAGTSPVGDALRRRTARLFARDADGTADALELLSGTSDRPSLRDAAQLAMKRESRTAAERVVRAWAAATHGTEHALSLVTLSEVRSDLGDAEGAHAALEEAQRSAPDLALIAVTRELLARRRGDTTTVAEIAAADDLAHGPIIAAAKLALDAKAVEQELGWLQRAFDASVEPLCSETLRVDALSEAGRIEHLKTALRAYVDRTAPHSRASVLIALSDLERRSGDEAAAQKALSEALELEPRSALLLRAYSRTRPGGAEVSRTFKREAEMTSGTRAAFAHLRAGYALSEDSDARLSLFASAYEASPSYTPTVWALHHESRRRGDLGRLQELHAREAGRARDALEAVAHLVRAALVRAGSDADGAALQLARGLDLMPNDPVLRELVIRLGDAVPATLRAEAISRMAEHAPAPMFERPPLLAAAGAFEDANQPARAAALYEAVLAKEPGDPIADMGLERVAQAAGRSKQLIEAKRRALEASSTPAARLKALEDLMEIEGDASPELSYERAAQLLELDPGHRAALRRLEQHAMEHNDIDFLLEIQKKQITISRGIRDKISRLRMLNALYALRPLDQSGSDDFDRIVLSIAEEASDTAWLGRLLMGSAIAQRHNHALARAFDLLIDRSMEPNERLILTLSRARLVLEQEPHTLAATIGEARKGHPDHPLTLEMLAEVHEATSDLEAAANHFEAAAKEALDPSRKARLWYRAGEIWQDRLRSPERARDALKCAAEADITYGDVQARLESLLSGKNDFEGLIALTEARIAAGASNDQLGELLRQLSRLYDKRGDKAESMSALKRAHEASPDNLAVLRDLAKAHERDSEYRQCAEVLIQLARLSRDADELKETFFRLGEIYDLHLPDPRRAEAAYRRVLKLGPRHAPALERLSALYKREGQHDLAVEALSRLLAAAEGPTRRREVAFELAKLKEDHGDARGAEETLEQLRKSSPTDLYVLRGLADFYRRQGAQSALAMHLNRAIADLRYALGEDFDDATLWTAMVEMLDEKSRRDAARVTASAAVALGLAGSGVVQHTDNDGNVPGVGGAAFSELLDDLVFPENVPPSVRIVFRHGAEALNKTLPFDLKVLGGDKLDKKHALRGIMQEMARWIGVSEVEVFVTSQLPYAFVPVGDAQLHLLVGRTLLESLTRGEQQFLVARAIKIAKAQMSITCRIRPEEMALVVHGLIKSQVPNYAPPTDDLGAIEEMARRVGKHVSKRAREDLLPHLMELAVAPDFDASRVYALASAAGNRAALLATGSPPAGLSALAKLSGLAFDNRVDADVVAQVEEARDLLAFAISEGHFEARQRAGADRR